MGGWAGFGAAFPDLALFETWDSTAASSLGLSWKSKERRLRYCPNLVFHHRVTETQRNPTAWQTLPLLILTGPMLSL